MMFVSSPINISSGEKCCGTHVLKDALSLSLSVCLPPSVCLSCACWLANRCLKSRQHVNLPSTTLSASLLREFSNRLLIPSWIQQQALHSFANSPTGSSFLREFTNKLFIPSRNRQQAFANSATGSSFLHEFSNKLSRIQQQALYSFREFTNRLSCDNPPQNCRRSAPVRTVKA